MTPIQSALGFAFVFFVSGILAAKNKEVEYGEVPFITILGFFAGLFVEWLAR